jgi:hypothetical protein
MFNRSEINIEIFRICRELSEAHTILESANRDWALKENDYRKKKATTYLNSEGTIEARKASVDAACETERLAAHIATGYRDALLEKIRSLRAQLSALETVSNSIKTDVNPPVENETKWSSGVPF